MIRFYPPEEKRPKHGEQLHEFRLPASSDIHHFHYKPGDRLTARVIGPTVRVYLYRPLWARMCDAFQVLKEEL